MARVWPAGTVVLNARSGGLQDEPVAKDLDVFEPDVGDDLRRLRSGFDATDLSIALPPVTSAQKAAIVTLWETDCRRGQLSFTATDPELGTTQTYKWQGPPKSVDHSVSGYFNVTVRLRRIG